MNLKDTLERLEEMRNSLDEARAFWYECRSEDVRNNSSDDYHHYTVLVDEETRKIDPLESAITLLKRYSEALEKIATLEVDQDDVHRMRHFANLALVGDLEPLLTQSTDEPTDEFGLRLG